MTTPAQVITTLEGLREVPVGAIVRSAAGTIACRHSERYGVLFGDDRPFVWPVLGLPVTVLWTPEVQP